MTRAKIVELTADFVLNLNLNDSDYYCYKQHYIQMLENIDGIDLNCLTFTQ